MRRSEGITLIYDGDCPICSAYCKAVALRALDPDFKIVNAREDHTLVADMKGLGFDMDEGFLLRLHGRYYHGVEAIHRLSFLTTRAGLFNRVNYWVFRSEYRARLLYPVLRGGRSLLLRLLGKKKFSS